MVKRKNVLAILLACMVVFTAGSALAAYIHNDCHDPCTNVWVTKDNPYYFEMDLPSWDFDKSAYTEATFYLTYKYQNLMDIYVYAADPASEPKDYGITLGTVPNVFGWSLETAEFDLLGLTESDFEALFRGQSTLYVKTNCHYVFEKACLHMEAVPIPATFLLFGSGLLGLVGFRRRLKK